MRLERLELENFRGFERFDLNLHDELTLIIGNNGSGKSALLDALAVALGAWFLGFNDLTPRPIRDDEIRRTLFESGSTAHLEPSYPVRVTASGRVGNEAVQWERTLHKQGGKTTTGGASDLKRLAAVQQAAVSSNATVDLPVIAYYGTGRLWVHKRESASKEVTLGSRLQGYVDCLDPASNQKLFAASMRRWQQVRVQRIADAIERGEERPDVPAPELDAVSNSVARCIEGARRLTYDLGRDELVVEMDDGGRVPFRLLSDGYRNLLGLVADIAWRAVQLNPRHGAAAPQLAEGVVLIDEIDLHLHPRWQLRVIDDLRRAFPRLQFVATTHAPQVITSAQPEWMRILRGGATPLLAGPVHGRDANSILEDVMNVPERLPAMKARLEALARLVDAGDLERAHRLLDQIAADLGEEDASVVRARWELADAAD